MDAVETLDFLPGFALEGFPNRDSTQYKSLYGLSGAHTMIRGTIRFKGFADSMKGLQALGLLGLDPHPALHPNGPELTWVCNLKLIIFYLTKQIYSFDSDNWFPP